MDTTKLREERARARAAKRQADVELFSFHERAIAALLDPVHGHDVRVQALATIALWERAPLPRPVHRRLARHPRSAASGGVGGDSAC